jgi:hypothetical protein
MIEQTGSSGDFLKMADLDDLNGAFYDIDAQDLLDVWEAMDTAVSRVYSSACRVGFITF